MAGRTYPLTPRRESKFACSGRLWLAAILIIWLRMAPASDVRRIQSRLKATELAVARLKVDTGLMFTALARNSPSLGEARRYVEQARRSYRIASRYLVHISASDLRGDLLRLQAAIADIDGLLREDSSRMA